MERKRFNALNKRELVTIYSFTDEYNQVVYSCVANNLIWAKELLCAQYPNGLPDNLKAYTVNLIGRQFKKATK